MRPSNGREYLRHLSHDQLLKEDSEPCSKASCGRKIPQRCSNAANPSKPFTYLRSWVLLGNPSIVQLLKNFPTFCVTRRFIAVFTTALHWSLSWTRAIQSLSSYPITLRSILILFIHLLFGLPSGLTISFNILKFSILPTECICMSHMILAINIDCFPIQH
jgi:hypothetical protein